MKFTKLINKFENLIGLQEQNKQIDPEKLLKLQQLLARKKSRYEEKLETTQNPDKRTKLSTRLKVVNAQLEKSKHLISDG